MLLYSETVMCTSSLVMLASGKCLAVRTTPLVWATGTGLFLPLSMLQMFCQIFFCKSVICNSACTKYH